MSKYNNDWTTVDGIRFQSKEEARYYELLKRKRAEGKIKNFEFQPKYELQPSFKYAGKAIRAITYTADFLIYHLDGTEEVVDIKGMTSIEAETGDIDELIERLKVQNRETAEARKRPDHGGNGK